jgi:hypothetical protein
MAQNLIPLASPVNTTVTMTSRELVDFINNHRKAQAEGSGYAFPSKGFAKLEHADFMKKAPEVLGKDVGNFSDIYRDSYGRAQPAYRFPKREATLMAMSYSYALQAAVYDHMTALEAKAATPDLTTDEGKLLMIQELATKSLHLLADNKRIQLERDEAIRTKAQIGSKREATAMATAASAKREAARLKHELGFSARHATILQVEVAVGGDFDFAPLRRWCKANEVTPQTVPDKRYPKGVKAWPAGAWADCYGVDLVELFGEVVA